MSASPNSALAPTIFHQDWWLDLVSGSDFDAVEVSDGGRIVGRLPFVLDRRLGLRSSAMPALTHFLGPGIDDGEGSANTRFLTRLRITQELLAKLPPLSNFRQKLHGGIDDVIAYQMSGFETSVQFTFELAPAETQTLWAGMRDKTRNVIRKGRKTHSAEVLDDPAVFTRLYLDNLVAFGRKKFYDFSLAERLIAECLRRGCGRIRVARNAAGNLDAGIFCIWDGRTCYYHLSTRHPDSQNGVVARLLWDEIQAAAEQGLTFDFDGIGSKGAALFFVGFGASVKPRFVVRRSDARYRLMREMRKIIGLSESSFAT